MAKRDEGSYDRVLTATGTEWEEAPRGFILRVWKPPFEVTPGRVEIVVPRSVARALRALGRKGLVAHVAGDRLILERQPAPPR